MATPIPRNSAVFSLPEILSATGGVLVAEGASAPNVVEGVSTDTRALAEGALFVALSGERFDGHAHLQGALAAGARFALVDHEVTSPLGLGIVRVDSTLDALGSLAKAHARKWRALGGDRLVVGITGSAGKTTTRVAMEALVAAIRPGTVLATSGNLNNRVGMPMMMLGLTPVHRIAILEMGMNEPGEIAKLAAIAEPDVGVLTLVAAAHTELLGSIEAVAAEKGALVRALPERGVALGNGDDARVRGELQRSPANRRHLYGKASDADVRIVARETLSMNEARVEVERIGRKSIAFTTPLLGEAGALACAAAIAFADIVLDAPLEGDSVSRAFAAADVGGGAGRLVPKVCADGLAIIDDSYNANPASACASIAAAAEISAATGRRLVLVLGEMRELGAEAGPGHDQVGRAAAKSGAAGLFTVVGHAERIAERAREAGMAATFSSHVGAAVEAILAFVEPGDLVLVKGSRGVATEQIVTVLGEVHEAPPTRRREP